MKPVVTRLYAVLVVLALVGLIAWSGADWYQRKAQSQAQGQAALRQVAGLISDLTIRHRALDAKTLGTVFARLSGDTGRWKMLLLSSAEQGTEYYRGPKPSLPVDQAVPRWEPKSFSEIRISLPVFRAQGSPLTLEGIYEFYGRTEVFSLLKAAGLTLVVLVVLTSLLVFWISRRRDEPDERSDDAPEGEQSVSDASPGDSEEAEPAYHFEDRQGDEAAEDEVQESVGTLPLETPKDEYWFDESLTLDDLPPLDEMGPPPLGDEDNLTFEDPVEEPAAAASPPSLFSPASGMGWESFLPTRLDHELQRCAEQNQDLALILLAIKEGSLEPDAWGKAVGEAFPSVDLDFEFEGGAAVVLPGRTLEQALKAARSFVESSDRYLGGVVIHAGVASRSGRLVSAKTLLAEANSARRRSLAGTVRVLGLKTDPDRYREHLLQNPMTDSNPASDTEHR